MYCKKCNSLIENDTSICPNCRFNNEEDLNETTEIYLDKISRAANPVVVKRKNYKTVVILLLFIVLGVVSFYVIKDSNAIITNTSNEITTQQVIILNKKFKLNSITMNYSDLTYGTSTNTIFNKKDNEFNIEINIITEDEYNELLNTKEVLTSKLGEVETNTFAEETYYSHIFKHNDVYYEITVNYKNDNTDESNNIKNELSKIINTLHAK